MSLKTLRDALPAYAADVAAGLDDLGGDRALSPLELEGCLIACAAAAAETRTLRALVEDAGLRPREMEAAKSAAAVTTLNNIYYGAVGALGNTEYGSMPARLSETALADPAVDRPVFELWCFAVSVLNGCGPSMDAHEKELRSRGVQPSRLQTALRAAALVGASARVLAAEAALEPPSDAPAEGGDDPAVAATPLPAPPPGEAPPT